MSNDNATKMRKYVSMETLLLCYFNYSVNKNTNNLVMAVDFAGIDLRVKKLVFIVNRRGREPAIATDFATANHSKY